jgi:hypothetical protein
MTKTKKLPGVPGFMYEKPSDKKMKLIKEQSYDYLKALSDDGEVLTKATERISGFIEVLEQYDADFKKIKPSLRKPSYLFIEGIR